MTQQEILKELAELKKQYLTSRGTACEVYGKNQTTVQSRVNGCCIQPAKEEK